MTVKSEVGRDPSLRPPDARLIADFLIMAPHGFAHYFAQNHTPKVQKDLISIFPRPQTRAQLDLLSADQAAQPQRHRRTVFRRKAGHLGQRPDRCTIRATDGLARIALP